MPENFEDLEKSITEFKYNVVGANELFNNLNQLKVDLAKIPDEFEKTEEKLVEAQNINNNKIKAEIISYLDENSKKILEVQTKYINRIEEIDSRIIEAENILEKKYNEFINKLESTNVFLLNDKLLQLNSRITLLSIINIVLLVIIGTLILLFNTLLK